MPEILSVLLTAKAPAHLYVPSFGPIISDLKTEERCTALKQLAKNRIAFFPPQIIVTENAERDLSEKILYLMAKRCPQAHGWTNHITTSSDDITDEWDQHAESRHCSPGYSSEFFFISVIGFGRDSDRATTPCYASGALSAVNEWDAYSRFKSENIIPSMKTLQWVGGLAQVLRITPIDFIEAYRSWYMEAKPYHHTRIKRTKRIFH